MAAAALLTGAGNESGKPYQENSTGQSIVFDKPANLANGHRLIAIIGFQNNSLGNSTTITAPGSGVAWTRIGPAYSVTSDANRRPSGVYLSDPITNAAGEPSTYTFSTSAPASRRIGYMCIVSGAHTLYPLHISGVWCSTASNTASQARAIDGVTTLVNDVLVVAWSHWQTNSATPLSVTWGTGTEFTDAATITTGTTTHSVLSAAYQTKTTAGAVSAMTATLSGSSTAANGAGYMVGLRAAAKQTTTMEVVCHRGIQTYIHGAAGQARTAEESTAGLDVMMAANPLVNGVEIDARLPSDWATTHRVVLCHDTTIDASSPNGDTGTVSSLTTQQLSDARMTFLDDYLNHIQTHYATMTTVMVQLYTAVNQSQVNAVINVLLAYPAWFQDRILVMTDDSNFSMSQIRTAGWTGRLGSYGMSASNWATGANYSAAFSTYSAYIGFTDPGDASYAANRSQTATMIGAGYQAGGSTILSAATMDQVYADGNRILLTDDPQLALSLFSTPAAAAATPAAVAAVTSVPSLTTSAGQRASISPAAIAGITVVPAQTAGAGAGVAPAAVAGATSVPAIAASAGAAITPSPVAGITSMPEPGVSGGTPPPSPAPTPRLLNRPKSEFTVAPTFSL